MDALTPCGTVQIALRNRAGNIRAVAMVDAADAVRVSGSRWWLNVTDGKRYAQRMVGRRPGPRTTTHLHHDLMSPPPGFEVDHISGDGLDCRRDNMRIVTHAQNQQNLLKRRMTTSRHRGVSRGRRESKWKAQVNVAGRVVLRRWFATEEEAATAARLARIEHMTHSTETVA